MRAVLAVLVFCSTFLCTAASAQNAVEVAVDIETPDSDRPSVSLITGWETRSYTDIQAGRWGYHSRVGHYDVPETRTLCTAPCRTTLAPGRHRFILTDSAGGVYTSSIVVDPGSTLRAHIDRRGAFRTLGHWTLCVGMIGSAAYAGWLFAAEGMRDAASPRVQFDPFRSHDDVVGLIAAGGVMLVSFVVGLVLANLGDIAELEVIPGGVRF